MICFISKWLISGTQDSHRAIPGFLRPHIQRCTSCQNFIHLSQMLEKRAENDAQVILKNIPDSLSANVKTPPIHPVEQKQPMRRFSPLIPIASVSLAAVILAAFLIAPSAKEPSPPPGRDSFFMFGRDSLPGASLQKLVSQFESPYDAEWNRLKKSVKSAAEHLRSQLDLKLDPNKRSPL